MVPCSRFCHTPTTQAGGYHFANVTDVSIVGAVHGGPKGAVHVTNVNSRVTRTLTSLQPQTRWAIEFGDVLLFDTQYAPIRIVDYTFTLDDGVFVRTAARRCGNGTVAVVETDLAVEGTVTITVDQSEYST